MMVIRGTKFLQQALDDLRPKIKQRLERAVVREMKKTLPHATILSECVYSNGAYIRVELIKDKVDPIRVSIKAAGKKPRGYAMTPHEALTLARVILEGLDLVGEIKVKK